MRGLRYECGCTMYPCKTSVQRGYAVWRLCTKHDKEFQKELEEDEE